MNIEIKISKKRVDYIKAVKYLEKRHAQVLSNKKPELIWILEHPPVFTAGISYEEKHLLDKNQNVITTDRGGKITYHGPGQIIFYTIINLNTRKRDIRWFINVLENTIIDTLRFYKIDSVSNRKKIGIWVKHKQKQKKIAAIGIKIKKWVTYHGFSLNVNVNLNKFKKIVPCGLKNRNVINIKDISNKKINNIKKILVSNFINNLEY